MASSHQFKNKKKATIFKSDNVIEYKKFEKLIEANDIKMKYTTAYTPKEIYDIAVELYEAIYTPY